MRGALAVVVLAACSSPAIVVESSSWRAAPHDWVSVTPDAGGAIVCAAGEKLRVEMTGELAKDCWPEVPCKRAVQILVTNCTGDDREMAGLRVETRPDVRTTAFEFAEETHPLPARSARSFAWPDERTWELGEYVLRLHVTTPQRLEALEAATTFRVVDPAKDTAQATCLRHGDEWGLHGGMIRTEGCEEVMHDAGKRCVDGRDCQGRCMLQKELPVSKTQKRVEGVCTRSKSRFGCHAFIGTTDHGLMPANLSFARTCVD